MKRKLKCKIIEKYNTQGDFAAMVGVHESVVSRVIRGRRSLTTEDVQVWAKALECDPEIIREAVR